MNIVVLKIVAHLPLLWRGLGEGYCGSFAGAEDKAIRSTKSVLQEKP